MAAGATTVCVPAIMVRVNSQVVVRRFEPARDAESLENLVVDQQNFHRDLEPSWPRGEAIVTDYLTYLETACAVHNGAIFLAEAGGHPAGFVCVVASTRGESPDDPASFAWIHDIFVSPEHRRHGVASLLMVEAERFARSQGARVMRLGVLDRNGHARAFYAKSGFREYTHVLTKRLD
jgi:GNAT superfamily N-acetyltransferase